MIKLLSLIYPAGCDSEFSLVSAPLAVTVPIYMKEYHNGQQCIYYITCLLDAQSSAGTVDDWMTGRATTFSLKIIIRQFSGNYLFNFSVLENLLDEKK